MVTNLDTSRLLVAHRPSSVTSRASSSRRHRQTRSHHGSSTSTTSHNEFPFFAQTGDVEISLTTSNGRKERRYLLHRLILAQNAGVFEDEMQEDRTGAGPLATNSEIHQPRPLHPHSDIIPQAQNSLAVGALARVPGSDRKRRWRYILDWGSAADTAVPLLIQREPIFMEETAPPPVSRNKPPVSNGAFFRSMANLSAVDARHDQHCVATDHDDEILRDYDNLFRIFYNHLPALDDVNIANAYTECKALLHLAEAYDALGVVGPRIDYHLLRFGNRLFKQIAKYPPSYLKLGCLARSKTIFSEALIHVVGQWPRGRHMLEGQTDPAVIDLVEDKFDILEETKAKIEAKLFRLNLTTSRGERVSPANGFVDWLAISLFRQWLAENTDPTPATASVIPKKPATTSGRTPSTSRGSIGQPRALVTQTTHAAVPQPGRVYHLLGSANKDAYLGHDEVKRFLKCASEGLYTRDNVRRVERKLDELKGHAREFVRPLVRNCLELDLVAAGLVNSVSRSESTKEAEMGALGYLTCTRVKDGDFPWED